MGFKNAGRGLECRIPTSLRSYPHSPCSAKSANSRYSTMLTLINNRNHRDSIHAPQQLVTMVTTTTLCDLNDEVKILRHVREFVLRRYFFNMNINTMIVSTSPASSRSPQPAKGPLSEPQLSHKRNPSRAEPRSRQDSTHSVRYKLSQSNDNIDASNDSHCAMKTGAGNQCPVRSSEVVQDRLCVKRYSEDGRRSIQS